MPPAFLPPLALPHQPLPRPSLSPRPPRASLTPNEPPSSRRPPSAPLPPLSPSPLLRDASEPLASPPPAPPLLVPRPSPQSYRARHVSVTLHLRADAALSARSGATVFALAATVANLGDAPVQVVGAEWAVDAWRGGGHRVLSGERRHVPVVTAGNEVVLRTAFAVREGGAGVVGAVSGRVEIVCGEEGEDFFCVNVGDTYLTVGEQR